MRKAVCIISIFLMTALAGINGTAAGKATGIERWITASFAKGKLPPFSFIYDGQESDSFIRSWKYEMRCLGRDGEVKYEVSYTDPATGLKISCDITGYPDFNAVDWTLHCTNYGRADTPQIEKFNALDFTQASNVPGEYQLHRPSDGSGIVAAFRRAEVADSTLSAHLQGLDPAQKYLVTEEFTGKKYIRTGQQLSEACGLISGEAPGAVLLRYENTEAKIDE